MADTAIDPRTNTVTDTADDTAGLPDLDFLDAEHPIYTAHKAAWAREERRFEGGEAVLAELAKFKGEEKESGRYDARKAQAVYPEFARLHATILAGHLRAVAPMPSFGTMGEVRERRAIDRPSTAELFYYNADGIGSDGSQWPAWWTDAEERGCATGHRWIMVEMPPSERTGPITGADVAAGHRPFLVEYSPLAVPFWGHTFGRLDFAVIRTADARSIDVTSDWWDDDAENGYYLLVRQGFQGFGPFFAAGGWFLFDAEKKPITGRPWRGDWKATKGAIPMFALVAGASKGTTETPAISRSLTTQLGQISVALMNAISARDFDAWDAAKSVRYILGADKEVNNLVAEFSEDGALIVPVPAIVNPDGTVGAIPTIYDSSAGAVASEVFSTIVDSHIGMARDIMVRQVSAPDSSGESKRAGFAEATSPLLGGLAARRESAENAAIAFAEMRAGAANPRGFVSWPREFALVPVVDKIDGMLDRMQKSGARSPTLEAKLLATAAADDGLVSADDEEGVAIETELVASIKRTAALAEGQAIKALTDAGAGAQFAAERAGLTAVEAAKFTTSAVDETVTDPITQ